MSKLTIFHLDHCPYCNAARRAVDALKTESAACAGIEIEWIEESRNPEAVKGRDYYYVPTVFLGEEKLYEAHPGDSYEVILDHMRRAFERAMTA